MPEIVLPVIMLPVTDCDTEQLVPGMKMCLSCVGRCFLAQRFLLQVASPCLAEASVLHAGKIASA